MNVVDSKYLKSYYFLEKWSKYLLRINKNDSINFLNAYSKNELYTSNVRRQQ
jgi:hypothetical protein